MRFSMSIRARLVFIVILIILTLIFQTYFINVSNERLQSIEEIGTHYIGTDSGALQELGELELTVLTFASTQFERFMTRLIFQSATGLTEVENTISDFNRDFSLVRTILFNRDAIGYNLTQDEDNIFSPLIVNATQLVLFETMMDNTSTGAYLRFIEMENQITSSLEDIADASSELRNNFKSASDRYVNYVNNMGTSDYGVLGNLTGAMGTVHTNLNTTNISNHTYGLEMTLMFDKLYQELIDLIIIWSNTQVIGFGTNTTNPNYIQDKIDDFNLELNEKDTKIYDIIQEINSTTNIREEEQVSLGIIFELYHDELEPLFNDLLDELSNIHSYQIQLEEIRTNDIDTIVQLFSGTLDIIRTKVITETTLFEETYNTVREQVETSISNLNNIITISLITIVTVILLLTNISIILSFRRLNAKFSDVTAGNLAIAAADSYSGTELGELESDFDELVKQLRTTLFTVQTTGDRLSGIAEELAAGSEEASASIKEVSDTMREFAGGASEQNIMLNRIIEKLEDNKVEVNISTVRIGEASAFVHRVAKRTNILGLNASIEAAKAGTYGLGFNVVAEEVRNLADTTKESATEIANTIEDVQKTITTLIDDILREIEIVREVAENTAAGSEEVSAATIEQVTMLTEVADTSNDLSLLAQELTNVLSRFQLEKK